MVTEAAVLNLIISTCNICAIMLYLLVLSTTTAVQLFLIRKILNIFRLKNSTNGKFSSNYFM